LALARLLSTAGRGLGIEGVGLAPPAAGGFVGLVA